MIKSIIIISLLFVKISVCYGQVRIRLFADRTTQSISITVASGTCELNTFNGRSEILQKDEMVLFSKSGEKIAVKSPKTKGFLCDSLLLKAGTDKDRFFIRINGSNPVRQLYSGNLQCKPDFGTLILVNTCDPETYIAGVVRAESGEKKNLEYFKSQAVIVRTYLYRNISKHNTDGFNLCDNTHCQVYNGITTDTLITRAARETEGLVILGPDTTLINSAFHSNCGGETAASEDVWLTDQTYLKRVSDPYCLSSRNAVWRKSLLKDDWMSYLKESGYTGDPDNPALLNFSQLRRMKDIAAGNFSVSLRKVREDLNLRSTWFTASADGDSVILNGRGYGHGVGLCQEGAMVMSEKGFDYKQIINFYYTGVRITDIKEAVMN